MWLRRFAVVVICVILCALFANILRHSYPDAVFGAINSVFVIIVIGTGFLMGVGIGTTSARPVTAMTLGARAASIVNFLYFLISSWGWVAYGDWELVIMRWTIWGGILGGIAGLVSGFDAMRDKKPTVKN